MGMGMLYSQEDFDPPALVGRGYETNVSYGKFSRRATLLFSLRRVDNFEFELRALFSTFTSRPVG